MTFFSIAVCCAVILACMTGYRSACNSALQGALLPHRIACRSAQLCGALLVLIVAWLHAPNLLIACVPAAAALLYAGAAFTFALLFHRLREEEGGEERSEFAETLVSTGIPVMFMTAVMLLLATGMAYLPNLQGEHGISALDRLLCHGLLLGVNTVLLCLLIHQMILFIQRPAETANASRAVLEFLENVKDPPTMR